MSTKRTLSAEDQLLLDELIERYGRGAVAAALGKRRYAGSVRRFFRKVHLVNAIDTACETVSFKAAVNQVAGTKAKPRTLERRYFEAKPMAHAFMERRKRAIERAAAQTEEESGPAQEWLD